MKKYEALFIVKPELSEDERKVLFAQLAEAVTKNGASITNAAVWSERRKLYFPIKKHLEGVYYLMEFTAAPDAIAKAQQVYTLNENVLRVMITVKE